MPTDEEIKQKTAEMPTRRAQVEAKQAEAFEKDIVNLTMGDTLEFNGITFPLASYTALTIRSIVSKAVTNLTDDVPENWRSLLDDEDTKDRMELFVAVWALLAQGKINLDNIDRKGLVEAFFKSRSMLEEMFPPLTKDGKVVPVAEWAKLGAIIAKAYGATAAPFVPATPPLAENP